MDRLPEKEPTGDISSDAALMEEAQNSPLPPLKPHPLDEFREKLAYIRGHCHMGALNPEQAERFALEATIAELNKYPKRKIGLRTEIIRDFANFFNFLPNLPVWQLAERYLPRRKAVKLRRRLLTRLLPEDPFSQP